MVLVNYSDSDSGSDTETAQQSCANGRNPISITVPQKRKADDQAEIPKDKTDNSVDIKSSKPPPSLPTSFHTLYSTNVRTSTTDDPDLHGGRKRQITHVTGNWPSHIYLEWLPTNDQLTQLDYLISHVGTLLTNRYRGSESDSNTGVDQSAPPTLNSLLRSPLSTRLPLHVSLSAPLVLNTSNKNAFRDRLQHVIKNARLDKLVLKPREVDLVPNFERSRWFLILRVVEEGEREKGASVLRGLLDVCNGVCEELGLPLLYSHGEPGGGREKLGMGIGVNKKVETGVLAGGGDAVDDDVQRDGWELRSGVEDAFHVSIAWTLKEPSDGVTRAIRGVDVGGLARQEFEFDRVKVKIGNVVDDVLL